MKVLRLLIWFWISIASTTLLKGQTDCMQNFSKAQRAYEEGRLNEVEPLLKNCIRQLAIGDRVKAYRLITLSNIFLDKLTEADDAYAKLLNTDPDYEPTKNEPIELLRLHKSFRTWPTASFGLAGGPILTNADITQYHSVDNSDNPNGFYSAQVAFQFGVVTEYYLANNFSVSPQFYIKTNKLKFEDNLFDFSTLTYTETQNWIEVPIVLRKYFNWRKFNLKPFVSLGASVSFLNKSNAAVLRDVSDGKDATGPDVNTISLRNDQNISALASVGIKKHFRHIYAFLAVSYRRDLLSQVNQDNRYAIPELTYKYGYVDNDYNTSHVSVSIGVSYALYNHKRKTPRLPNGTKNDRDAVVKKRKK